MREAVVSPIERAPETDSAYACARLRGMRAHLLGSAFYERLGECPDIESIIRELMETDYADQLESELVHGHTSSVVDEALKDHMVHSYRKVLAFLDAETRELLATLLGRWDIFNLKTVLRGAHNHVEFEVIKRSLIPAGYLGTAELEGLARLEDVGAVVDTVAMWGLPYAASLRRIYPDYVESGDLATFELALDRHYAEWAASRLVGASENVMAVRKVLESQVDATNLVTVFRTIKDEVEPARAEMYFLEGGRAIRRDVFLELVRLSDVDELLDRLRGTQYGDALDEVAVRFLEKQSISVFERALEELVMRRALRAGVQDPLGVGVAIAYLWGKQNEVTNLRIIVRGKEVGMPADRVRQELILV